MFNVNRGPQPLDACVPYHKLLEAHFANSDEAHFEANHANHFRAHSGPPAQGGEHEHEGHGFRFSSGQAQRIARHRLERRLWDPAVQTKARDPAAMMEKIKHQLANHDLWFHDPDGLEVCRAQPKRWACKGRPDRGCIISLAALCGVQVCSISRWQMIAMLEAYGCSSSHDRSDTVQNGVRLTRRENMFSILPRSQVKHVLSVHLAVDACSTCG